MSQRCDNKGLVLAFPEYCDPARNLATAAGLNFCQIDVHCFPDGESRIRLPGDIPEHTVICRSLNLPNEKLIELVLAASTARSLGAKKLTLVAPYLCYMRQDSAFHPGEAVSQQVVGGLLASYFDEVVTVDPHLHRVKRLEDAVPVASALAIGATAAMSAYLAGRIENPIVLGPDEESEQWVAAIAQQNDLEFHVARKQRLGDSDVRVYIPVADYLGRHIVLVDDVASTGHTLEAACRELKPYRPASITVLVTHALFVEDALERITLAGADNIWSCDSVIHPTNRIKLADSLAKAIG